MDTTILNLLQQAGFTEKEARIYLAMLELGKGDATEIAKKAELKRSIVYVIIDELIEKGYASRLPNRKINTYQAIDPGVILNQIRSVGKNLTEMLPYLRSLHIKSEKKPKIHFIDTKEGILNTYYNLFNFENQFFISSYERMDRIFPGQLENWIKKYKSNKYTFSGRHLLPNKQGEMKFVKKLLSIHQEVRIMPSITEMSLDFSVCGNSILITCLDEKPYLILIESAEMAKSLMSVLEIAWKSAKEIA